MKCLGLNQKMVISVVPAAELYHVGEKEIKKNMRLVFVIKGFVTRSIPFTKIGELKFPSEPVSFRTLSPT